MRQIFTMLAVAAFGIAGAQIAVNEQFETTPGAASGFTVEGFFSSATPAGCTARALSKNFWSSSSNSKNTVIYSSDSSNGGKINISFKYKHPRATTTAAVNGTIKVEYAVNNGEYALLDTIDLNVNQQFCQTYSKSIDQDLVPAGKNFKLKITGNYVSGDFYIVLDELIITQNSPVLAVSDASAASVRLFPNPVQDLIQISDYRTVAKITITDFSGRTLKTLNEPSAAINISNLKTGSYLATVILKDGSQQTHKFLKK